MRCGVECGPMNRRNYPTRRKRLNEPDDDAYLRGLSPGERIELVWPLTLQAWEFMTGEASEPRLRRHVVRVVRGRR